VPTLLTTTPPRNTPPSDTLGDVPKPLPWTKSVLPSVDTCVARMTGVGAGAAWTIADNERNPATTRPTAVLVTVD
jgi:hypothetical protein